jgi:hypothetical protein
MLSCASSFQQRFPNKSSIGALQRPFANLPTAVDAQNWAKSDTEGGIVASEGKVDVRKIESSVNAFGCGDMKLKGIATRTKKKLKGITTRTRR